MSRLRTDLTNNGWTYLVTFTLKRICLRGKPNMMFNKIKSRTNSWCRQVSSCSMDSRPYSTPSKVLVNMCFDATHDTPYCVMFLLYCNNDGSSSNVRFLPLRVYPSFNIQFYPFQDTVCRFSSESFVFLLRYLNWSTSYVPSDIQHRNQNYRQTPGTLGVSTVNRDD